MCQATSHESFAGLVPGQDSAIFPRPRLVASARIAVSSSAGPFSGSFVLRKLSPKEIRRIRVLLKTADLPVAEIAARFGIARSTLYRSVLSHAAG